MAIQVNGTTVINNSRALQNIASVDATTVATMSAAGVGGYLNRTVNFLYTESGTFVAPLSGKMVVQAIGAGGGGAAARVENPSAVGDAAGGAAGGYSLKAVNVTAGDTYTFTVGARGAQASISFATNMGLTTQAGGNGGTTTVTGPSSFSISATGGGGGGVATGSGAVATSGAAGSGSGGTINTTGGTSSTSGITRQGNGWLRASWGGSISIVQGVAGATNSLEMQYHGGNFYPLDGTGPFNDTSNPAVVEELLGLGRTTYVLSPIKFDTSAVSKAGAATWSQQYYCGGAQGIWGEYGGGGGGCIGISGGNYQSVQLSGKGGAGAVSFAIFTGDVST
mgnify:CR=1 FL=1